MKKSATTNKPSKQDAGAGGVGKGESQSPGKGKAGGSTEDREGRTIHNGSAGAFDATEHSHDEEDEDQDSDDFAMDR